MADFVFNVAKGRVVELYNNVDTNTPSGCKLVIMVVNRGAVTDATLKDLDTFSAVLGSVSEVTNTNYARKTLVAANLAAISPDDTNDRFDIDLPDQTWSSVAAGTAWTDLVIGYDPLGTNVNANIIPMTCMGFTVTPDGSDITAQFAAAGFFRAS